MTCPWCGQELAEPTVEREAGRNFGGWTVRVHVACAEELDGPTRTVRRDVRPVIDEADLFAQLETEMGDVPAPDVEDVTALGPRELLRKFHRVERDLTDMGEVLIARTDRGREYHSRRYAYLAELRRRGIL